jgi:hypothetical protein
MNLTRSLLSTITQYICTLYLVFALFSLSLLSVLVSLYWDTCDAWSADLFQLASLSLDLVYALYDYVQPVLTTTAQIVDKVIDLATTWIGLFAWLFMRLLITVFFSVTIAFVLCWNPFSWSTYTISCIWSAVRFCSLALFACFCFQLGYWLMAQLMLDGRLETVSWFLVQLSSVNLTCWFDFESYCPYDAEEVCNSVFTESSSAALSVTPALAISDATYQTVQPQLSGQLGAYLAGLTESDGSISVPQLGSDNTPTVKIAFHIDDKPLAEELKLLLGYGSIQPSTASTKGIEFVIRSQEGILDIINLINGNMRTPKIEALHTLIDWVNSSNWDVPLLLPEPLDQSPLDSNAWLAGFSFSPEGGTVTDPSRFKLAILRDIGTVRLLSHLSSRVLTHCSSKLGSQLCEQLQHSSGQI